MDRILSDFASALAGLTPLRIVTVDAGGNLDTPAAVAIDQSLETTSTLASKATGGAGIALDNYFATGDFTLKLTPPATLGNDRVAVFPDSDITVAGINIAQTWTGDQTFSSNIVLNAETASRIVVTGGSKDLDTPAAISTAQTVTLSAASGTSLAISSATNTAQTIAGGISVDHAGGLAASTAPAIRLNGSTSGDVIAIGSTWTTAKFDSQGTAWSSRTIGGGIVFNQGSADRPEINWYRGSRSYPEFSIRQHGSADTGGQVYAGPGTVAPTLVVNVLATGIALPITTGTTLTVSSTNATAFSLAGGINGALINQVYYATTNGAPAASARFTWQNSTQVLTIGDGSLASGAYCLINAPAGQERSFLFRSAGSNRWALLAGTTSESGSNAGSPFQLVAYSDAGSVIDVPITITRAQFGLIDLARPTKIATGTITSALPVIDSTTAWNSGGTTFTGWKLNVTDTASAAASLLLDLQVGGTSKFNIRKDGALSASQLLVTGGTVTASTPALDATQTWNNGAVAFTGLKLNVTNTASANGSYLIDLQQGGTSRLRVDPSGALRIGQANGGSGNIINAAFDVSCGAHTAAIATNEVKDVAISCSSTQWSAGAITTQRAVHIVAPSYSFTSASTITTAATLCISGAPGVGANATITNNYALWVVAGTSQFDGGVRVGTTTLISSSVALTNGAGAGAGTITNAPAAGNPTKWVPINDNGTTRYIPAW